MGNKLNFFESRSKLQLVMLPGLMNGAGGESYYNSAYELWKSVWSETLKDLDGNSSLHSDQFTRQDLIIGLFRGNTCVGLSCFRAAQIQLAAGQDDSWFVPWPKESLHNLSQTYPNGYVSSFFTVHPDWRKSTEVASRSESPAMNISAIIGGLYQHGH